MNTKDTKNTKDYPSDINMKLVWSITTLIVIVFGGFFTKWEAIRNLILNSDLPDEAAAQHQHNENLQLWTHENHAIELSGHIAGMADQKLNYIHDNAVEAGWVENAEDYLYSSARDYAGKKGLVKSDIIVSVTV